MNIAWLKQSLLLLQNEIQILASVFREKGPGRFLRPIALGLLGVFACYYLLYLPPAKKMATLKKRIETAKATARHADAYRELRDRLFAVYAQLPVLKDRDQWLTNTVMETMKAENVFADQIRPPEETEQAGFVFQRMEVTTELKFQELVSWLVRLESTKPLLHVSAISLNKRPESPGRNVISCGVSTVVPVKRVGQ